MSRLSHIIDPETFTKSLYMYQEMNPGKFIIFDTRTFMCSILTHKPEYLTEEVIKMAPVETHGGKRIFFHNNHYFIL